MNTTSTPVFTANNDGTYNYVGNVKIDGCYFENHLKNYDRRLKIPINYPTPVTPWLGNKSPPKIQRFDVEFSIERLNFLVESCNGCSEESKPFFALVYCDNNDIVHDIGLVNIPFDTHLLENKVYQQLIEKIGKEYGVFVRQYREIGETDWIDCDDKWYEHCKNSVLHDVRKIPFDIPPSKAKQLLTVVVKARNEVF